MDNQTLDIIQPHKAYKLSEASRFLNMHHVNIRKILNSDNTESQQFINQFHPVKVAGQWRILGENLLVGLGSTSYQNFLDQQYKTAPHTGGAAPLYKKEK